MFIVNGIAYASEPGDDVRVTEARPVGNLCMLVRFATGEQRLFDASPLLEAPAFAALADPTVFERVSIEHGVVTWADGTVDIAPEKVYAMSYEYVTAPDPSASDGVRVECRLIPSE